MKDLVILQNEQAITTSLKVAEVFEKRHDNVIQAIEKAKIALLNFKDSEKAFVKAEYVDTTGKSNPMYYLNRDAFSFVVMGFTGEKAAEFKWKYIQAFNKMEQKLIEILAERKSAEWLEVRNATKVGYRELTDTIQQVLIPLAREQGSTAPDNVFFMNYTKSINKKLGIKSKSRDKLPVGKLYEVEKMQSIANVAIRGQVAKGEDYHQIYRSTDQTLENYSRISFTAERFLN